MKIKSIHITNYGALSNFDYKFNEGITSFCEDNGYGKSTIASFIKAMFYGLESVKSSSKSFLDRAHFYPFDGSTFGGYIIFTYNNKEYRIERTFDIKSESKDILKVYLNNKETDELGDIPGEKIFGINKESYERLLSFNADKIAIESDNDINKKLNNYIENVSSDFDIDDVIKKIKELKKNKDNRLTIVKDKIKEIEISIHNLEGIKASISPKYQVLSELNKEINNITKQYDLVSKNSEIKAKWDTYDQYLKDIDEPQRLLNELEGTYPHGLPSKEEVNLLINHEHIIQLNNAKMSGVALSKEENDEYRLLKEKYDQYLPSEEDITSISESIDLYNKNLESIASLSKVNNEDRVKELEYHFSSRIVSEEDINSVKEDIDKYLKLSNDIQGVNPVIISSINNEVKKPVNNKLFIILAILALLLIGGGISLFFVQMIIGIIALSLGVITLIVGLFLYVNMKFKQVSSSGIPQETSNPEYQSLKEEIDNLKQKILLCLATYRYKGEDLLPLYYSFIRDVEDNNKYLSDKDSKEEALNTLVKENESLKQQINEFFTKLSLSHLSFVDALETLKQEVVRYETLHKIVSGTATKEKDLKAENEESIKLINDIYNKYQIPSSIEITAIKEDVNEHERLTKQIKEKKDKAINYKKDNNLLECIAFDDVDLDKLSKEKDRLMSEYISKKHEIEGLENEVSSLDDKYNLLTELEEEKKELEKKIKIYKALNEEIVSADERLKEKYVAPIRDKFVVYAKMIEDTLGEKVHMDSSYHIYFDRVGKLRSYEHLSSGILSICSLCFRLALLDNMFNEEKPFVIMDDPFTSLDETRFTKTKELIKLLSKDKQIIYFSCHPSRDLS